MKTYTKQQAGAKGGAAISELKKKTSAANGAKGGRPRKATLLVGGPRQVPIRVSDVSLSEVETMQAGRQFGVVGYIIHAEKPSNSNPTDILICHPSKS